MTAQNPMPTGDPACTFCHLLAAGDARWVALERRAVALLPQPEAALAPGHTLVATRAHAADVFDVPVGDYAAVMGLVRRVGASLVEGLGAEGVVILNASGAASGQSVPHMHFHLVPCWHDDEATFWPTERSNHVTDDASTVLDRIRAAYRLLYPGRDN